MSFAKNSQSTFRSYVDITNNGVDKHKEEGRSIEYLPGETEIAKCESVLRYVPFRDKSEVIVGTLYVTNFKISFIVQQTITSGVSKRRNKLIHEEDIVLNNVHSIYQVSKGKRKKILPGNGSTGAFIKNIEIHCKDFRVHTFSFKMSSKDNAKRTTNSVIHHCLPGRVDLLFAYDCQLGDSTATGPEGAFANANNKEAAVIRRFDKDKDWIEELERLGAREFRLYRCNNAFHTFPTLPEMMVVPESLKLEELKKIATCFTDYRIPVWSYSCSNGAALIRMGSAIPEQTHVEKKMLDLVKAVHPNREDPVVFELSQNAKLPTIKEIQTSHEKLRELCMPGTLREVTAKENNCNSTLENTNWLVNVAKCLAVSIEVVHCLQNEEKSAVLKELNGRDLTPLISSLVQIMIDPSYRTQVGFQELIEREWVAMGHNFTSRLGLVLDSDPCPLFLLFLDCVWQLHQQFPSAFAFSEIYLTALWDTLCLGIFDNFIFDCIHKRVSAKPSSSYGNPNLTFMCAWNWSWQYDKEDQSLFNNPLYKVRTSLGLKLPESHRADTRKGTSLRRVYSRKLSSIYEKIPSQDVRILRPVVKQPLLKLWKHNYLRWVTPVQIMGGGSPSEYLQQCLLVEEIVWLQHKIASLGDAKAVARSQRPNSELLFSSASPAGAKGSDDNSRDSKTLTSHLALTSSFPYTPQGARGPTCLVETLVSAFLENSFIQEPEDEEEEDTDQNYEQQLPVGKRE